MGYSSYLHVLSRKPAREGAVVHITSDQPLAKQPAFSTSCHDILALNIAARHGGWIKFMHS